MSSYLDRLPLTLPSYVEVYAHDFRHATVYIAGEHPDTLDTKWLQPSRRLKNLIEERFSNHGTTHPAKVSEIQRGSCLRVIESESLRTDYAANV